MTKKDVENLPIQENDEPVDGAGIAARILRNYPASSRDRLLIQITSKAPALAQKIQDKMCDFEEIRELTPQGTQALVREIDADLLATAVLGASDQLKEKILQSMSARKREVIEEDVSRLMNAVRPEQIKAAQWQVLQILDDLRKKGAVRTEGLEGVWV